MKIAVWHNLPSGGGKRALYDQVRGLTARGHHVEAWRPPTDDSSYLPLTNVITEHEVALNSQYFWSPQAGGHPQLNPLRRNIWSRLRAMEKHCQDCAQQINAGDFDLLFATSCMYFHAPHIARYVALPSVLYLQEPNRCLYEALPVLPWLAREWEVKQLLRPRFWRDTAVHETRVLGWRVLAREERKNAMAFNEILVNSYFSRESVLRAFGIDSTVCYLGVDTNLFVNQNKKRESFVVSVGALIPEKNSDFLVRALSKVPKLLRPKLILIANTIDAAYRAQIQSLAMEVEVTIEIKHRIGDVELIDLLNRARVMVYAPRLEPFGYAPVEASACGLPVIAVAEGGVRETIRDGVNGILVSHKPESMAAAVERIMSDNELHAQLSHAARHDAQTIWSLAPAIDRLEQRLISRAAGSEPKLEMKQSEGRPVTTPE